MIVLLLRLTCACLVIPGVLQRVACAAPLPECIHTELIQTAEVQLYTNSPTLVNLRTAPTSCQLEPENIFEQAALYIAQFPSNVNVYEIPHAVMTTITLAGLGSAPERDSPAVHYSQFRVQAQYEPTPLAADGTVLFLTSQTRIGVPMILRFRYNDSDFYVQKNLVSTIAPAPRDEQWTSSPQTPCFNLSVPVLRTWASPGLLLSRPPRNLDIFLDHPASEENAHGTWPLYVRPMAWTWEFSDGTAWASTGDDSWPHVASWDIFVCTKPLASRITLLDDFAYYVGPESPSWVTSVPTPRGVWVAGSDSLTQNWLAGVQRASRYAQQRMRAIPVQTALFMDTDSATSTVPTTCTRPGTAYALPLLLHGPQLAIMSTSTPLSFVLSCSAGELTWSAHNYSAAAAADAETAPGQVLMGQNNIAQLQAALTKVHFISPNSTSYHNASVRCFLAIASSSLLPASVLNATFRLPPSCPEAGAGSDPLFSLQRKHDFLLPLVCTFLGMLFFQVIMIGWSARRHARKKRRGNFSYQ